MRRIILSCFLMFLGIYLGAQDVENAYEAAAEAAVAIDEAAQAAESPVAKPKYWNNSLSTNISFGQTGLVNWAAGGYNNYSLKGYFDVEADYSKNTVSWTNRLQLDYGFFYSADKPVLQKSDDRIYLESKFAYNLKGKFNATAELNFKTQFSNTYSYPTPTAKADGSELAEGQEYTAKDWRAGKTLNSSFAAPAYANLALGIEYVPTKWLTINLAPLTGGIVAVRSEELRESYSMPLYDEASEPLDDAKLNGARYKPVRFEFGAQLKVDIKVNVNDNFKFTSQVVLFSNYLDKPQNIRVNWDNRIEWELTRFFSLVLTTNLIYDDTVLIDKTDSNGITTSRPRVQFNEGLSFGFVYSIATKN